MRKVIVAGDLGGTYLKLALFTPEGKQLGRKRLFRVPRERGERNILKFLRDTALDMLSGKNAEALVYSAGIPGLVDHHGGVIFRSPHFPGWRNFQLKKRLEGDLSIPVLIDNDANLHALAEAKSGRGRHFSFFVHLTLGTGIGGAIVKDGKVIHGGLGTAGEVGHITAEPEGRKCNCGNRGCVERYASSEGMMMDAEGMNLNASDAKEIFDLARAGNSKAMNIVDKFSYYLAILCGNLINTLSPEAIIIGGGLSGAWSLFKPLLMKHLRGRVYADLFSRVKLLRSSLGNNAGIQGAYLNAAGFLEDQ